MRELVAVMAVLVLGVGGVGCDTSGSTGTTVCDTVIPDGGNGGQDAGLACDLAWSCNSDVNHYELQCVLNPAGTFECVCFTESVQGNAFVVQHFACNASDAAPAATASCGWTLM